MVVVELDRGLQRPLRKPHLRFELGDGRSHPGWRAFHSLGHRYPLERFVIAHEIDVRVLVEQGGLADAARVGVLVDEALPGAVDDYALRHQGRRKVDGRLTRLHVLDDSADRQRHVDHSTVVAVGADLPMSDQTRGVVGQHLLIADKAATREDDAPPGPDGDLLSVSSGQGTDDHSITGDDQPLDLGVAHRLGPRRGRRR